MTKKTADDYAFEIKMLHYNIAALPAYHPDVEALENTLSGKLKKWADLVNIVVFAASNEQEPFTEEELGLPIRPMHLKSDSGFRQVADYLFQVNGTWGSLAIERKGVTRENGLMIGCDIYSSLFNKSNRERFKKEYLRFQADSRLDMFKVLCECSYGEFLSFTPPFNGKKRNVNHIGASVNSRVGSVAHFEDEGCHFIWAGNRERAVELYRSMIRHWVIRNYKQILKIEV